MDTSTLAALLSFINLIVVGISAYLLYRQIVATHEWNRRHATQSVLGEMSHGQISKHKAMLKERGAEIYNRDQTYATFSRTLDVPARIAADADLIVLLNYSEALAIGLKDKVFDEDMCYDFFSAIMVNLERWSAPYVVDVRHATDDTRLFIEFEHLAGRWRRRKEQESKPQVRPGKPVVVDS